MARPRCLLLLAAAALVLPPGPARGDDSNFRPYLVGGRAAGLGGAFTALADDGSGPFYNPGGLAFVQRSQLSLSGSVYGLVRGRFESALGDGHDFTYSALNVFPTATSGVWRLDDGQDPDRAQALAASVFVPDALLIDDRDGAAGATSAFFYSEQVQTIWGGLTYARRHGRLGVGVAGFATVSTRIYHLDFTFLGPPDLGGGASSVFENDSGRTDETILALVGAAGARWDATEHLHLGLAVFTPGVGGGSRRVFARALRSSGSAAGGAVSSRDDLHASPAEPWRVQAGAAWSAGALTVAGDLVYLAAREVVDDAEQGAAFERTVSRRAVVDVSLGVEYVVAERYPLRAGFFTDLATSPPATAGAGVENTRHIDRYGLTASAGLRTEHTSTDLGASVAFGSGTEFVPDNLDFTTSKATGADQTLLYVFLATAYHF